MIISIFRSMVFPLTKAMVFPLTKPSANLLTTSMVKVLDFYNILNTACHSHLETDSVYEKILLEMVN